MSGLFLLFLQQEEQSQLLLVRPFTPLRVLVLLRLHLVLVMLSTLWLLVVVAVVDTTPAVGEVLVDIEPLQVPLAVVVVLNLYFQYLLDLIQLLLVVVAAQQLRRLPETGVMGTTLPSLESSLPPVVVVAVVDPTVKWVDRAVVRAVIVVLVHQEPPSRVSPAD